MNNAEVFSENEDKYIYNAVPFGSNTKNEADYYAESNINDTEELVYTLNNSIKKRYNTHFDTKTEQNLYSAENSSGFEDNVWINNIYENIANQSSESAASDNYISMLSHIPQRDKIVYDYGDSIDENTEFYYDFADNVNNFGDKTVPSEEKAGFIHNISNFSENIDGSDYSYIRRAADTYSTNNYSDSSININMGGVTQNITEGNCEDVMDMLVESLMRGLSCKGSRVY